jgi:hypothetical protein
MAVSQISMSDSDITGINQAPSQIIQQEKKEEPKKNYDKQQSMNMDELMGNLTSSNKPAGKILSFN